MWRMVGLPAKMNIRYLHLNTSEVIPMSIERSLGLSTILPVQLAEVPSEVLTTSGLSSIEIGF